jgi:CRP-like cAMP-binding protein
MSDNYWSIKSCGLFSQISLQDVQQLESHSKMRRLKRGEPVYLPSQTADGVLLVASGRVKICHVTPDGKLSILNFIDSGEIFGELVLVDSDYREEYAEAAELTTLVLIPRDEILKLMSRYPHVSLGITKLIGLRRQRIERRLRNLLFRSNRQRIVHLLLELAEKYGQLILTGYQLKIDLSHQEIASIIGSTRETVTVVLGQLQTEGLIEIARRRLTICDLTKLAAEVQQQAIELDRPLAPIGSWRALTGTTLHRSPSF